MDFVFYIYIWRKLVDTFKGNLTFQEPQPDKEPWPANSRSLSVTEWLLGHGFALNSRGTQKLPSADYPYIRIYGKKPAVRELFGLIPYQPSRPFIGYLHVEDEAMGVSEKKWVFDTHCGKDIPNNLLYELEQHFKVHIFFLASDYYLTNDG